MVDIGVDWNPGYEVGGEGRGGKGRGKGRGWGWMYEDTTVEYLQILRPGDR